MHTDRLARFVAILLFVAALIYLCGGAAVGLYLWNRGLGAGWGSGFSGWVSIPIFAATIFGALTLLLFGAVLFFLTRINTNLAVARQRGILREAPRVLPEPVQSPAAPIIVTTPSAFARPEATPSAETVVIGAVEPATEMVPAAEAAIGAGLPEVAAGPLLPPAVELSMPEPALLEPPAAPDLSAELPDADIDGSPQEFTGRLPGAEEVARIASEIAAAQGTGKTDA
jgi:hypothetical protein